MNSFRTALLLTVLIFFLPQAGLSQTKEDFNAVWDEINALKEAQKTTQKEIREIKSLLKQKSPVRPPDPEFKEVSIDISNKPFKGDESAQLALIEFSDYQ